MQPIPSSTVSTARTMLAEGWRPTRDVGVLAPPPNDKHSGGWHLIGDDVWWCMCTMSLQAAGKVRTMTMPAPLTRGLA